MNFPFHTLMVQGTTSDAGKTTVVAGLCRWLSNRGVRVVPFKPQNMALNSAVTADGGEIGRAQALQAHAARVAPHTDMNPVLLKPTSDTAAQVVILGKPVADMHAIDYHTYKAIAMDAVLGAYRRLRQRSECIVVEGAGSPAEINLRDRDIANMGFAEAADCPVTLVADIDRGGVFAHLLGTLACLSESERRRVVGFVINRFRGDLSLLAPGLRWIEEQTGKPVLGVLPYLHGLALDAEDAIALQQAERGTFRVVVPALPRISNHTDFDALRWHPDVDLVIVGPDRPVPPADLIILPGSKNTRADLGWLPAQGWEAALRRHLRYGGKVMGICGGFQMLGREIADPHGMEGPPGTSEGLGWFDAHTTLARDKQLRRVTGRCAFADAAVQGYEIHLGDTRAPQGAQPAFRIGDRADGLISDDGLLLGTYLHGVFDHPDACRALLQWAGLSTASGVDLHALREASLDRVAAACEGVAQRLCELPAWDGA